MSVMSELSAGLDEIREEIALSNNGKLMLVNLPRHLREFVPALIEMGALKKATFMESGDSIVIS